MSLAATVKAFSAEMSEQVRAEEIKERSNELAAKPVTASKPINSIVERVQASYEKMTAEWWEHILDTIAAEIDKYPDDSAEHQKAEDKGYYTIRRYMIIQEAYGNILAEQHKAKELLKKLNEQLKKLDNEYYSESAEQLTL